MPQQLTLWLLMITVLCACNPEPLNPRRRPSSDMDDVKDLSPDLADMATDGSLDMKQPDDSDADLSTDQSDMVDLSEDAIMDMVEMTPAYFSQGCQTGNGLAEGEHSFMLESRTRKYTLRLPKNYDPNKAWPLVLALHGNGGDMSYWDTQGSSRDIRKTLEQDAILIVALAINKQWRDYSNKPLWPERIESELLYFEEVITQAKNNLCINTDNIFAMGFSGGGSFSGLLGCRRSDIRAFAAGGAVIYFDESKCINTPAAWITIGKNELNGREPFREFFRERASCRSTSQPTAPMPCVAYDGCGAGTPVHYCEHPDAHIWPDFGTQAFWDFFKQFVH